MRAIACLPYLFLALIAGAGATGPVHRFEPTIPSPIDKSWQQELLVFRVAAPADSHWVEKSSAGRPTPSMDKDSTGFNLGGIYDFAENYHLLFSAGRGLTSPSALRATRM